MRVWINERAERWLRGVGRKTGNVQQANEIATQKTGQENVKEVILLLAFQWIREGDRERLEWISCFNVSEWQIGAGGVLHYVKQVCDFGPTMAEHFD